MVSFKYSKGPAGQLTSKQKLRTDMEYYRKKSNKELQQSYARELLNERIEEIQKRRSKDGKEG